MIKIKNLKVFNCSSDKDFHWSKLLKLKEVMEDEKLCFPICADLRGANLGYAHLGGADLRGAHLGGADLSYAHLGGADLRGANLGGADLSYANLCYANLRYANLCYANLRYADLCYANLCYANLRYADLGGADLGGAKLEQIDGKDVIIKDFMIVTGLGSANRQTIIFDTNIGIVLICGCFYGTEKAFKKQVKEVHKGKNYEKEYLEMLKLAHIRFSRPKGE